MSDIDFSEHAIFTSSIQNSDDLALVQFNEFPNNNKALLGVCPDVKSELPIYIELNQNIKFDSRSHKNKNEGFSLKRSRKNHKYIDGVKSVKAINAYEKAKDMGYPLNIFISVNYDLSHSNLDVQSRISKVRDRLKSWFYRNFPDAPLLWIEAREDPNNDVGGFHWLIHLPDGKFQEFSQAFRRWIKADCEYVSRGAVNIKKVYSDNIILYLIKATEKEAASQLQIPSKWSRQYQGTISGPRLRLCQALNKAVSGQ